MSARKRKADKETVESSQPTVEGPEADGEPGELIPAEHNDNYDSDITLTRDTDGFWFWVKNGEKSEIGYTHPSMARLSAPSDARND